MDICLLAVINPLERLAALFHSQVRSNEVLTETVFFDRVIWTPFRLKRHLVFFFEIRFEKKFLYRIRFDRIKKVGKSSLNFLFVSSVQGGKNVQ